MSHPNSPLLSVQGVELCFGPQRVLAEVDLTVHASELVALIGPSGCGKSTLPALSPAFRIPMLARSHFSTDNSFPRMGPSPLSSEQSAWSFRTGPSSPTSACSTTSSSG